MAVDRLRHVRAGYDNAVKQAEERGLHDIFIIDTDTHQVEPFSLFAQYLPDKWKKFVTNKKLGTDTEEDPFLSGRNQGVGRLTLSTLNYSRNLHGRVKRPEGFVRTTEEVIELFSKRMYDIGIKRSILFPTNMLSLSNDPRLDLEVDMANAYIDYMLDNFLGKYPEILTALYVPANSPEKAAELIDRVGSEKGIVGIMITPKRRTLGGEDSWNPIYHAAQRKDLPICFHGGPYNGEPFDRFDQFIGIHSLSFPFYLILQMTSIILEGVPERFPNLKFVWMEGGTMWIPWLMHRLDSEYIMRRSEAPLLKKLPSQYIKEFYFTSQPLEQPMIPREREAAFRTIGAEDHMMYASDYPHWDMDVPSVIYDLPFLSKTAKKKILGENAAKLFKIK